MARLAVRKVIYNGKKFYYESPLLNDGLVILEGVNGRGKSTFMNLIYYGLGGKVKSFDSTSKDVHKEICTDEENYVELQIEIDNKTFEITRYIGDNHIFILTESSETIDAYIHRNANQHENSVIFSDWILNQLGIDVFDIVQGTSSFKLNFSDLMRLIYHDQTTEIEKIYKEADNTTFISDSLEMRKAIFEVLIGKSFNDYYLELGAYKLLLKKYDKALDELGNYNNFINDVIDDETGNTYSVNDKIKTLREQLVKIDVEKQISYNKQDGTSDTISILDQQKISLRQIQKEKDNFIENKESLEKLISKLTFLLEGSKRELQEIERIRFVNKKLNLFTPNTCPYCLSNVERKQNLCICGSEIDESQYEKFFYTDSEYLTILKIKQKSIITLTTLLQNKYERKKNLITQINKLNRLIEDTTKYIVKLNRDIEYNCNFSYIEKLNAKESEIKSELIKLTQAKELIAKQDSLAKKVNELRTKLENQKTKVEKLHIDAKEDISNKKLNFSQKYFHLMKKADNKCYDAYIADDYMPIINLSEYRERSASVSKRLMYFTTLLIESLCYSDVKFPQFLMIDTPNKEGIDIQNLMSCLSLFSEVYEAGAEYNHPFQIILTTGIGLYPPKYKDLVFSSLSEDEHLLKVK